MKYLCHGCRRPRATEGRCRPCALGNPLAIVLPTKAPRPTRHRPGTEGKVAELCRRFERGEHLFHEKDGRV